MSPADHAALQASVYDKTLGMIESALEKSVGMKSVGKGKTKKMTLLIQRLGQLAPECCNRYDDITRLLDESGVWRLDKGHVFDHAVDRFQKTCGTFATVAAQAQEAWALDTNVELGSGQAHRLVSIRRALDSIVVAADFDVEAPSTKPQLVTDGSDALIDWQIWIAKAQEVSGLFKPGDAQASETRGELRALCAVLSRLVTAFWRADFEHRRNERFAAKGSITIKTRGVLGPKAGMVLGAGSAGQLEESAKEVSEWFDQRGQEHPLLRAVSDRRAQGWAEPRKRYRMCDFSDLSQEAQDWYAADVERRQYFGLPEVSDIPPTSDPGSLNDSEIVERFEPQVQDAYGGGTYAEADAAVEAQLFMALQPAAWLPSGDVMWGSVLDEIDPESPEFQDGLKKTFATAEGPDRISVGCLRWATPEVQAVLCELFNEWLATQQVPRSAKLAHIWKIMKPDASGERPVSLLSQILKMFTHILQARLMSVIEEYKDHSELGNECRGIISKQQFAFMRNMSSVDCAGITRAVCEDCRMRLDKWMSGKAVDGVDETGEFDNFLLYMDWAKFYDSISKSDIELCLRARKVPEPVIALILDLGSSAHSCMLSELGVSPEVSLSCTVRRRDSLSCCSSLFVGEIVIRHCSCTPYTMSWERHVSTIGFADDTCCIAGSRMGRLAIDDGLMWWLFTSHTDWVQHGQMRLLRFLWTHSRTR